MGSYTIIADTGNALVRLLRKELVPDIISGSADIGLASPADKGNMALCVYLYDVAESETYRVSGMVSDGVSRQKFPPVHLTLFYMITAFSSGDVKFRSEEEQRILGKVVQVLHDYPVLNMDTMEFDAGGKGDAVRIEMRKIPAEEKLKTWIFPNQAHKMSLFYSMGPVSLESSKTKDIKRVKGLESLGFQTDYRR